MADTASPIAQNTGLLSLLQGVLGSATDSSQKATSNNTTTTNSDTTDLHTVLAKQLAGITPEQIQAIYQQGAKAVPTITNTFADANGNRINSNTGVANSLSDLNANLLSSIAQINANMTNAAAGTAANITNANKTTTQSGTTTQDGKSTTTIDTQKLLPLLAGAAGVSGLNALIGGGGSKLVDLAGKIPGIANIAKQLGFDLSTPEGVAGFSASGALDSLSAMFGGSAGSATVPELGTTGLFSTAGGLDGLLANFSMGADATSGASALGSANPGLGPLGLFYTAYQTDALEPVADAIGDGLDSVATGVVDALFGWG